MDSATPIKEPSRYLTSLLFTLLRVSYTYQIEESKQGLVDLASAFALTATMSCLERAALEWVADVRHAISLYFAACERDDVTYGMIDVHPVFLRRSFLRKDRIRLTISPARRASARISSADCRASSMYLR